MIYFSGTSSDTDISLACLRKLPLNYRQAATCENPTLRSVSIIYHRLTAFLRDSKSADRKVMGVRPPLPAPNKSFKTIYLLDCRFSGPAGVLAVGGYLGAIRLHGGCNGLHRPAHRFWIGDGVAVKYAARLPAPMSIISFS